MFTLSLNSGDDVGHDNGDGDEDDDSDDTDHTRKVGVVFGEDVTSAMAANRGKMSMLMMMDVLLSFALLLQSNCYDGNGDGDDSDDDGNGVIGTGDMT